MKEWTKVKPFKVDSPTTKEQANTAKYKTGVRKIWINFFRETTFHGFRNVQDCEKYWVERAIWTLVVVGMMCGMLYFLCQSYIAYYKYNVITTTQIIQKTSLPFPAITICNLGRFDKTKGSPFTESLSTFIISLSEIGPFANKVLNDSDPEVSNLMNSSFLEFYKTHAYNVSEMVEGLKYDGNFINPLYIPFLMKAVDTDCDRCYMFNGPTSSTDHTKLMSTKAGYEFGFLAYINIKQEAYPIAGDTTAGIRVSVHEPHEFPRPKLNGIVMAPGTANFVKLQRTVYKFLPYPYKSYGDSYCIETTSPHFRVQNYSYDGCVLKWVINRTRHDCNCSASLIGDDGTFRECSFKERYSCIASKSEKYYQQAASGNVSSDICPRPCQFVIYKPQITSSAFPSKSSVSFYSTFLRLNRTEKNFRDNYIALYVFYDQFLEQRVEYVPEYTSMSILGNLGGQMGFFLGASLVTVTEVAQTTLLTFWTLISRFLLNSKP